MARSAARARFAARLEVIVVVECVGELAELEAKGAGGDGPVDPVASVIADPRAVLTQDLDFGAMVALSGGSALSVSRSGCPHLDSSA